METQAQQDFLASQGCKGYQGYDFSRPVPVDALETWVLGRAKSQGPLDMPPHYDIEAS